MRVFAFMRIVLITTILLASAPEMISQSIVVHPHEKEATLNIDELQQFVGPQASGGCSELKTTFQDEKASGGCAGVLIRNYVFADNCGNTASAMVFIHLKDTTPPQFDQIPVDVTASEGKSIPPPAKPTAKDNSGTIPEIVFSEKKEKGFIIRTWTASDDCGNSSEIVQKIKY